MYDFALPLLVLHAFTFKTAVNLKQWVEMCPRRQITVRSSDVPRQAKPAQAALKSPTVELIHDIFGRAEMLLIILGSLN